MMRTVVVALCLASAAAAGSPPPSNSSLAGFPHLGTSDLTEGELKTLFARFKAEFARRYADAAEESARFEMFQERAAAAVQSNRGARTPVFGVTKFSDRTDEEVSHLFGSKSFDVRRSHPSQFKNLRATGPTTLDALPDVADWNAKGAVGPVRDQGQVRTITRPPNSSASDAHTTLNSSPPSFNPPLSVDRAGRSRRSRPSRAAAWSTTARTWSSFRRSSCSTARAATGAPAGSPTSA